MKQSKFTLFALAMSLAVLLAGCGRGGDTPAPETAAAPAQSSPESPTETDGRVRTGGIDKSGMDTSVRPQDDFFQYANGKWLDDTPIPADKSRWGPFGMLAEKSENDIRALVDEIGAGESFEPGSPEQKIGDFYNSYLDTAKATELGVEAIRPELDVIANAADLEELVGLMGRLGTEGVSAPFGLFIFSDLKDADINVVYLGQDKLTLPDRDYYLLDDERYVKGRELYRSYVQRLFDLAGREDVEDIAERLLAFETRLAEVQWTREENRDPQKQYNPHSPAELTELSPGIAWARFFEGAALPPRDQYIIQQPSYFETVDDILAETDMATLREYMQLKLLSRYAPMLGDDFFMAWFDMFRGGLQGVEQPRPPWKRAVATINNYLGQLLGQLYVERHFKPHSKARMDEMIGNLIDAYRQSISELKWMGEETRQRALEKLSKFTPKVGFPDKWIDYSSLQVIAGDLVGNVRRAAQFDYRRNLDKLDRPVDRSEWFVNPQTVNAYYNPTWNEVVFPAAILQPPFFDPEADDAVNYGGIGAVIGHEIGHGFDDQGRKFDGDGSLRDWWTAEDNARFNERKDRLVEQYNGYEVIDGLTINGEFTAGENIGDLGGLSIAYKAYRLSLNGAEAPVIDGLTGDQRFFLGWAQVWRAKTRPDEARRRLTIDPHSPARYRVNGTVVNIRDFYEAFNVQEGDGMYLPPEQRVKIW